MPQTKPSHLADLALPPLFEENRPGQVATAGSDLAHLHLDPPTLDIPLAPVANPAQRPRILIADDEVVVIEGLKNSLAHYEQALNVRFWRAGGDADLLEEMERLAREEDWRPQVVILDINLAHGGRNGLDYLEELRKRPGLAALAVVLATGQQRRDLDLNENPSSGNLTGIAPVEWLRRAKNHEPEFVLFGKTSNENFLGRIGESASTWIRMARRRAWQMLLNRVAELLDSHPDVKTVSRTIVQFATGELHADDAFVRWRNSCGLYELVAKDSDWNHVEEGDLLDPKDVPILAEILEMGREPVAVEDVSLEQAGEQPRIAGRRFIGVGAMLDERPVGFIMLFRAPENQIFDLDVDGKPLAILARLLAAALGRAEAIRQLRERQQALLSFAGDLAQSGDRIAACVSLAAFLHREIHGDDDEQAKVTVRLIDFGSGDLKRWARSGIVAPEYPLTIFTTRSIYAKTVRGQEEDKNTHYASILIDDVEKPGWRERYQATMEPIRAELCVPLLIGGYPIGTVNLEHKAVSQYKDHDRVFAEAAAAFAAQALERMRRGEFIKGMLGFIADFARLPAEEVESRLRQQLYDFCNYSVLVVLEPTDDHDIDAPWRQVGEVDMRLTNGDKDAVRQSLVESRENWETTWLAMQVRGRTWVRTWASYTNDSDDFHDVSLGQVGNGSPFTQRADALLWLRRGNAPPHRVLLLLWGLPPPLGDNDIAALGQFAALFSSLAERQDRIRSLTDQALVGEQAAAIGHVMQHFRHRLVNDTGDLNGHVESLERTLGGRQSTGEKLRRAAEILPDLREAVRRLGNSFGKAEAYVKRIEDRLCPVEEFVSSALNDLGDRLAGITIDKNGITEGIDCWTDPVIASLIVYSLLENAADAVKNVAAPRIAISAVGIDADRLRLRIEDNGVGISADNQARLFQFGFTTKPRGLGSALAFAGLRAYHIGAELRLASDQPAQGAAFELLLSVDQRAFIAATLPKP